MSSLVLWRRLLLLYSVGIVIGEFALYGFVLEPLGLSGHYWERGPRDGETFTRW